MSSTKARTRAPLGSATGTLSSNRGLTSPVMPSSSLMPSSTASRRVIPMGMASRMKRRGDGASSQVASENRQAPSSTAKSKGSTASSKKRAALDESRDANARPDDDDEGDAYAPPLDIVGTHSARLLFTEASRDRHLSSSEGQDSDGPTNNLADLLRCIRDQYQTRSENLQRTISVTGDEWINAQLEAARDSLNKHNSDDSQRVRLEDMLKTPGRSRTVDVNAPSARGALAPVPFALNGKVNGKAQPSSIQERSDVSEDEGSANEEDDREPSYAATKTRQPTTYSPIKPRPRAASRQAKSSIRSWAISSNADPDSSVRGKSTKATTRRKVKPSSEAAAEESDEDVDEPTSQSSRHKSKSTKGTSEADFHDAEPPSTSSRSANKGREAERKLAALDREREAEEQAALEAAAQEQARAEAAEQARLEEERAREAELIEQERLAKEQQDAQEARERAEREAEATRAKAEAEAAAAAEKERKRLERERKAQEKKRLEAEKAAKEEEERLRRQAEKEAAERAEVERQERLAKEEAERKKKEEAERKKKEEAERKKAEEAERKKKEEEAKRKKKEEAERKFKEEAERKKQEAERKRQEADRKRKEEAERKRQAEEEKRRKEEADRLEQERLEAEAAAAAAKEAAEQAAAEEAERLRLQQEEQAKKDEEARIAAAQAQAEADAAAEAAADAEDADDEDQADELDSANDDEVDADSAVDNDELDEGQLKDHGLPTAGSVEAVDDDVEEGQLLDEGMPEELLGPSASEFSVAQAVGGNMLNNTATSQSSTSLNPDEAQRRTSAMLIPGQSKPAQWNSAKGTAMSNQAAPTSNGWKALSLFGIRFGSNNSQAQGVSAASQSPAEARPGPSSMNANTAASQASGARVGSASIRPNGLASLASSKSGIPASTARIASSQATKPITGTGTLGKKQVGPASAVAGKVAAAAKAGPSTSGTSKMKKVASPLKKIASVASTSGLRGAAAADDGSAVVTAKKRKVSPTVQKVTATATERPVAPASPARKILNSATSKFGTISGSKSKAALAQSQQANAGPSSTLAAKLGANVPFSQQNDFQQSKGASTAAASGSQIAKSGTNGTPFTQRNDFQQSRSVSAHSNESVVSSKGKTAGGGAVASAVPQRMSSLVTGSTPGGSRQSRNSGKLSLPRTPGIRTMAKRKRYNDPNLEDADVSLPDIQSEYSDSGDEQTQRKRKREAEWTRGEGLEAALLAQTKIDADELFGDFDPNSPPDLNRMMPPPPGHRPRHIPRTSSANWAGPDQLAAESMARHRQRMQAASGASGGGANGHGLGRSSSSTRK